MRVQWGCRGMRVELDGLTFGACFDISGDIVANSLPIILSSDEFQCGISSSVASEWSVVMFVQQSMTELSISGYNKTYVTGDDIVIFGEYALFGGKFGVQDHCFLDFVVDVLTVSADFLVDLFFITEGQPIDRFERGIGVRKSM